MTLSIVPPSASPDSLLINRIISAYQRTQNSRSEWIDATLDLAQALADARALKASDQDFGYWLDQNGFTYIGKNDRAALIGMAADLVAARKMLEATDRTSWRHIWENERLTWFPHVGKPQQRAKSTPVRLPRAKKKPVITVSKNQERNDEILAKKAEGLAIKDIATILGIKESQVHGVLHRDRVKNTTFKPAPTPKLVPTWHAEYKGLQGLTREQVDPDFKGNDIEFAAKYGHVNLFNKEQIEVNKEDLILQELFAALKTASQTLAGVTLPKPETVQAWLAKPNKKEKLANWLAPIEKVLALLK